MAGRGCEREQEGGDEQSHRWLQIGQDWVNSWIRQEPSERKGQTQALLGSDTQHKCSASPVLSSSLHLPSPDSEGVAGSELKEASSVAIEPRFPFPCTALDLQSLWGSHPGLRGEVGNTHGQDAWPWQKDILTVCGFELRCSSAYKELTSTRWQASHAPAVARHSQSRSEHPGEASRVRICPRLFLRIRQNKRNARLNIPSCCIAEIAERQMSPYIYRRRPGKGEQSGEAGISGCL